MNRGVAGVVFHVYDKNHLDKIPHRYTVESGKSLEDTWQLDRPTYDFEVFGPNGFFRRFYGGAENQEVEVSTHADKAGGVIEITLFNPSSQTIELVLQPNAYAYESEVITLKPFQKREAKIGLAGSGYWYDFSVSDNNRADFEYRLAGRIETGKSGISDPAMAMDL